MERVEILNSTITMKRSATVFLQVVVIMIAIGALAFLLGAPHREGRNANATTFEVYFKDPFLAYVYVASIAFFTALYQAFRLLRFAGKNMMFTPEAVQAIRIIKYCALIIIAFVFVSVIFVPFGDPEDRPPGVMMRLVVTFGAIVVAAAAATFERLLQNAVEMKSENDLTV